MRKVLAVFIFLFLGAALSAQVGSSPTEDFYRDAIGWALKNYTSNLPLVRPYPVAIIRRILDDVVKNGEDSAKRRALFYLEKYFSQSLHAVEDFNADIRIKKVDSGGSDDTDKYESDELYNENLSFTFDVDLLSKNPVRSILPQVSIIDEISSPASEEQDEDAEEDEETQGEPAQDADATLLAENTSTDEVTSSPASEPPSEPPKPDTTDYTLVSRDVGPTPFFMSISGALEFVVRNNGITKSEALPRFVVNNDPNVVVPLKIKTDDADFFLNPNIMFAWGNETLYGTVGINKAGCGLFYEDNLILNPYAYQTINASFNYHGPIFSYTQTFNALAATKVGASGETTSDFSLGKFMAFHIISFPIKKSGWSISLYESVVFHKPFMPAYLLPLPYFLVANLAGYNDNVMSGLNIAWHIGCAAVSVDLLLDDLDPKMTLKLKANEAAIRTGFKLGFVYSPPDSPCESIAVNYMLLTPYTYTKYNEQDRYYNYLDYTNFGQSMGSSLPPNSDTIGMTINWRPFPNFRLRTSTSFSRHGNAYQDLDNDEVMALSGRRYSSDGLIGMDTKGQSSATDVTGFLKQHDVMYIMQASIYAEWEQRFKRAGGFTISVQYTFEYINKDGVDAPIYHGTYHSEDEVEQARNRWEEALHDSFNNYFTVGFKYFF